MHEIGELMIKQALLQEYYSWLLLLLIMKAICTDHRIIVRHAALLEWIQGRAAYYEINESPLLGEIYLMGSRVFIYYQPETVR